MDMNLANKALSKAKINLMTKADSAFFTTICFSMKHVWDDTIPTACTDGLEISYNPTFFMSLTTEEQVFLLLHESMHVAFLHMVRLMNRKLAKWNVACDHVINLMLIERGYKMPACGVADNKYVGLSADEVYNLLPDQDPSKTDMDLKPSDVPTEVLEELVQDILVRAAIQSKISEDKAGTIPGELEIFLDRLLDPKLPWHSILRKYLNTFSKNDYSFKKPNRRYFPEHHLPSLHSEGLIDIAIAVDISCSVSDHEFHVIVSETVGIFKNLKPKKITLIQFDTTIQSVDTIQSIHDLKNINFVGRGGTAIEPVLDWVKDNKPQLLLVFTDGFFRTVNHKPAQTNVLWLIHNNPGFTTPFGKPIYYDIKE